MPPTTVLDVLKSVLLTLTPRVDHNAETLREHGARLDSQGERIAKLEGHIEARVKGEDKPPADSWLKRNLLEPAIKQKGFIPLYALVLLIGAKSCGVDVGDVVSIVRPAAPVPTEPTP